MNRYYIFLTGLIALICSCIIENKVDAFEQVRDDVRNHFISHAREDSIKINALNVLYGDTEGINKLRIFWEIDEYAHAEFIIAYNEMMIRSMDKQITDVTDSVILEIQLPDPEFGLKRYRADKQDVKNLRKEYQGIDDLYNQILRYIMRTNTSKVLTHFDEIIEHSRYLEDSLFDTSMWYEYPTFLQYLRKDFLLDCGDSNREFAKIQIFKTLFGNSTLFFSNSKALKLVNYILELKDSTPMEFDVNDTTKSLVYPDWLTASPATSTSIP